MPIDPALARLTFRALSSAMNARYAGKYWITCGTLLGFVRDHDFMAHTGDIDLAMHIADFDEGIIAHLAAAGFANVGRYNDVSNGLFLKFHDGRVRCDIFFCYEEGNRIWHAVSKGWPQVRYYYDRFPVGPFFFEDVQTYAPVPPEAVLMPTYGEEWRTPVLKWHYAYSPSNVTCQAGVLPRTVFAIKHQIWRFKTAARSAVGVSPSPLSDDD
jgi:hypothetical protein